MQQQIKRHANRIVLCWSDMTDTEHNWFIWKKIGGELCSRINIKDPTTMLLQK